MTDSNRAELTASHLDHSLTWLDVSASYGRERSQLLAVDDMTRNARIAEANNQQAHALKLAEIHAQLAVAEELRELRRVVMIRDGLDALPRPAAGPGRVW